MVRSRPRTFKSNSRLIGISDNSLKYWRTHKDTFGKVVRVIMYDYEDCMGLPKSGKRRYGFILVNDKKERMYIGGCNAGYSGEGPRVTATILHESGIFGETHIRDIQAFVYGHKQFEIYLSESGILVTKFGDVERRLANHG